MLLLRDSSVGYTTERVIDERFASSATGSVPSRAQLARHLAVDLEVHLGIGEASLSLAQRALTADRVRIEGGQVMSLPTASSSTCTRANAARTRRMSIRIRSSRIR